MVKKILIACEESQAVCIEFRKLGFEAYSCDLLPCSGGHPEWHFQGDVLDLLGEQFRMPTQDGIEHDIDRWDLMIAHPPCTYLSVASAGWERRRLERRTKRMEAAAFFKALLNAGIPRICIENPVMFLDAREFIGKKYDQVIEPFQFGEPFKKRTCLWLKNLPKLEPTDIVEPTTYWVNSSSNYRNGKKLSNKGIQRDQQLRSKTFPGIAKAMAEQWSKVI